MIALRYRQAVMTPQRCRYTLEEKIGFSIHEEHIETLYKQLLNDLRSTLNAADLDPILSLIVGEYLAARTGFTPAEAQLSQVYLYIKTSGLLQEILSEADSTCMSQFLNTNDISKSIINTGILSLKRHFIDLDTNGYLVLPEALTIDSVQDLRNISYQPDWWTVNYANGDTERVELRPSKFLPPNAVRLLAELPLNSKPIIRLAEDPKLVYFVTRYLGGRFYLRHAGISISTPASVDSVAEAAQQYHFDIDSHKWLKVFVYLSDVGYLNGPHAAVYCTHKPGSKSPELLKRGYSRISDEDIDYYHPGSIHQIIGKAGTLIFADTRCFHKGNSVKEGLREMLVLQFSNSRFGDLVTTS